MTEGYFFMNINKLKSKLENKLNELLDDYLTDDNAWEDEVLNDELSEDDIDTIINELIPNCTIKIKID